MPSFPKCAICQGDGHRHLFCNISITCYVCCGSGRLNEDLRSLVEQCACRQGYSFHNGIYTICQWCHGWTVKFIRQEDESRYRKLH